MLEEKREHLRIPEQNTIFIELIAAPADSSETGELAICKSRDVSHGGLQVALEQELKVGAILHIAVQLPESTDPLYLAGEVTWSQASEDAQPKWSAGFKLMNASDSDIDNWTTLIGEKDCL